MLELTRENYFDSISNGLAIVDIGASWCPDCRHIQPIMETLESEYDNIKFFAVDFSNEEELKDTLNIKRIPTLIFYKDGKEVGQRLVEPKSKAVIQEQIESLLK
ncbi:thioredoxin [Helicobacter muridarum]|uniref:Thioredoxin n=1 Tax=Helicobacter muridarum TaxID=216 RepID=A0A099TWV8_9HELI|nr:thioredoxin family protein [Helicobacter muridarum]TLD99570.1 thioredoxin [Helicobacter muridarum]STQ85912.1 putative THIOREDOXIN [Helicobacter muridarum]